MNMVAIYLCLDSKVLIESDFLELEPYAPSTNRKFVLRNVRHLEYDGRSLYYNKLTISISYLHKDNELTHYTEFQIRLSYYEEFDNNLCIFGDLSQDEIDKPYRQGMTDVFKLWEEGKKLDWFSLPLNSYLKYDYILACMFYSGMSGKLDERTIYEIDIGLVREEKDFLYLASLAFIGDMGYIGYDLYTFNDCLLTIFHKQVKTYFTGVKVLLLNTDLIPEDIQPLYQEIRNILVKYEFEIIV